MNVEFLKRKPIMEMRRENAAKICLKIMLLEGNEFPVEENFLRELIADAEKCLNYLLDLVMQNQEEDYPPIEEFKDSLENDPEIAKNAEILNITPEEYQQYLIFMYQNA